MQRQKRISRALKAEAKRNSRATKKSSQHENHIPREVRTLQLESKEFHSINGVSASGLDVKKIPILRGVGVFATQSFKKGDVILRYVGDTITLAMAEKLHAEREKSMTRPPSCAI